MLAQATRAGGRFVARDRGIFEVAPRQPDPPARPSTGILIERLAAKSLAAVAQFCGLSIGELIDRAHA